MAGTAPGAWPGAILFVSHDRDFLDAVAERVVEVTHGRASSTSAASPSSSSGARSASLLEAAARPAAAARVDERFVERFRYKATKARQVQSRVKALEKLERSSRPTRPTWSPGSPSPSPSARRGRRRGDDATVGFDGVPVLSAIDLVVERGQKLALIGPNGAGKTTLLRLLLGQLPRWSARSTSGTTSTSPSSPSTRSIPCASTERCSRSSAPWWRRARAATCNDPGELRVPRRGRRTAGR